MSGEPVIRLREVSRWFGPVVAVSDVSLDIGPGITGLLGPNGAGKTTLLRMMTGLAAPSSGSITVFGQPVRDNPPLYRRLGVMSEHETVYASLKGREFVRMMGRLRGVARRGGGDPGDRAGRHGWRPSTARSGPTPRHAAADATPATLVHDPEVLILDEPLNGADPRQRVHFQRLLRTLADEGRTIVLSSHILEEVEELAETVSLVINGKLAATGGFRAIRAALNQRPYHVRVLSDAPRRLASAVTLLDAVDAVHLDPDGALVILSRSVLELQLALPRLAQEGGIRLLRVEPLDDSLESVFGYLVER